MLSACSVTVPFVPGQAIVCSTGDAPEKAIIDVRPLSYQTAMKKRGFDRAPQKVSSHELLIRNCGRRLLRGLCRFRPPFNAVDAGRMRSCKNTVRVLWIKCH